jgi:hypothetical protein
MIQKVGSLESDIGPILVNRIITNSVALAIGYSVKTSAGFVALGTAGARVLGHVQSLIGKDGLTPVKDGTFYNNIDEVYTVASDNETNLKIAAVVDVDTCSLYSADMDAAVETTTGSSLAGKYFDLVNAYTLDESTVTEAYLTLTEGTPNTAAFMQYYSHGLAPNDSTNTLVNVTYSEVFGV